MWLHYLQRTLLLLLFTPLLLCAEQAKEDKTVLLAILARNKEHVLPEFLRCIDNQTYDKKQIIVYINTNNNEDRTKEILEEWAQKQRPLYRSVIFESHEVSTAATTRPHEWNAARFKLLGTIRNKSMLKAIENNCAYYFVVDCDNFIAPSTLTELVSKDKPIIAPMLRSKPHLNDPYSNYFCAITEQGYYQPHADYPKILTRSMVGTFRVPVVHCTYLIQSQYIPNLTYVDGTDDFEFVIFSRSARKNDIPQYICNEKEFGWLLHFYDDVSLDEEKNRFQDLMKTASPPTAALK